MSYSIIVDNNEENVGIVYNFLLNKFTIFVFCFIING